jgi:radical SAM protein with 4Fe4S-binding SPASM domain
MEKDLGHEVIQTEADPAPAFPVIGPPPSPTYVQIEPVGQCNLRCEMCAIQFRQDGPPYGPPAFMVFDDFVKIVDGFQNINELHLQGLGEPFMHPRFFDMVAYAVSKGIRVTTNTNMTLLNPKRAEQCITSGLDTIHVSIDGANAATYEKIRVKGKFDRVLYNLNLLREAKRRLGSSLPHLKMVMVIMRQNLAELPDLVELAVSYGMEEIFVQHLSHDFSEASLPAQYKPMHEYVEQQTLLNEDLHRIETFFDQARQQAESLGITLRLPQPRPHEHAPTTPGYDRCSWPWTGAYISYQGLAMPCCMISTPDRVNFGSVVENGVEAVWNSDAYQNFRAALSSGNPPEVCQSCSIYKGIF